MAGMSQYLEDQVLNWMKGTTVASAPATTYVVLFTTAPSDDAGTITFPTPTGNWGTTVAIGIYDASSSGNLLWWNTIASQTVNTGVVASFAAGALVITLD